MVLKAEESDKNKVVEQKDEESQTEENKDNAILQQKLKELVKKEEKEAGKEKLIKEIFNGVNALFKSVAFTIFLLHSIW